jgi:hypothetical protein
MNVYILKDRETTNYFVGSRKWTPHPNKAKLFSCVSRARESRAKNKGFISNKIDIIEFELVERRSV